MSSILKTTNIKHESSSSNNLVLASDGNVSITNTLSAGTIGGGVAMASSGVTVRNFEQDSLSSDQNVSNDSALTSVFTATYTPKFTGSKVLCTPSLYVYCREANGYDARKKFIVELTGSGITNTQIGGTSADFIGTYSYDANGLIVIYMFNINSPLMTTSTLDTITANVKMQNSRANSDNSFILRGNGTAQESHINWIEYK